jgi:hypothetical protein
MRERNLHRITVMREVIAVASMLFFLAISGSEASDEPADKSCAANFIVSVVVGC